MISALLSCTENFERRGFEEFRTALLTNSLDGPYEERYKAIVERYKDDRPKCERMVDYFKTAFDKLVFETTEEQHDVLGDIYMEYVSRGYHGQFFTPEHITELMAKIVSPENGNVLDSCCGSGRMLIAASKSNPQGFLTGIDLDSKCAKMTALNMFFFDLNADVYCGNSLTAEMSTLWQVRKGGLIFEKSIPEDIQPVQLPLAA